jgi:hypothetical protein
MVTVIAEPKNALLYHQYGIHEGRGHGGLFAIAAEKRDSAINRETIFVFLFDRHFADIARPFHGM